MENTRGTKGSLRLVLAALLAACALALCAATMPATAWAASADNCAGGEGCVHEAAIDGVHYDTLADAVEAAADGNTVKLLKDIKRTTGLLINESMTVDLNSHILECSGQYAFNVTNGASLVIKNGSLIGGAVMCAQIYQGNLKIADCAIEGARAVEVYYEGAVLDVDNCDITTSGISIGSYEANVKVNITSSTIVSEDDWAVYHNGSNGGFELAASNTTIESKSYAGVYIAGSLDVVEKAGKNQQARFANCTVIGATGIEGKYTDIEFMNCMVTATGSTPTFVQGNSGSSADSGFAVILTDNTVEPVSPTPSGKVKINGGNYTGPIGLSQGIDTSVYPDFKEATYEITGGTFSSDPSAYLAANHVAWIDSASSYVVMPKSGLAPGKYKAAAGEAVVDADLGPDGCEVFGPNQGVYTVVGHPQLEELSYIAPTCTDEGRGTGKLCATCKKTVEGGEVIPAVGHKAAADKRGAKAATCTEAGYTGDEVCSACNAVIAKGKAIPALGHKTDGKKWGFNATSHWAVCDVCGEKAAEPEAHKYKNGKCTVCGAADPTYVTASVDDAAGAEVPEQAAAEQAAASAASSVIRVVLADPDMPAEEAAPVKDGVVSAAAYEAVKEAVTTGQAIDVVVESVPVSPEAVPAADKDKVISVVGEGGEVVQYLDLSVVLKVNGKEIGAISKLDAPVKFTVAIPESLVKDGRTFYVVRVHDGKAERLPTAVKDGFATFETNLFSTYALAYEDAEPQQLAGPAGDDQKPADGQQSADKSADAKKPEAVVLPATGDAVPAAALAALGVALAAAAVCGVAAFRKRSAR